MVRRILWTDEMREVLRMLWHDKTQSMPAIAYKMHISMENIRNEAGRMGFVPRAKLRDTPAYCYQPTTAPIPAQPLAPGAHTLPPLPSELAMKGETDDRYE